MSLTGTTRFVYDGWNLIAELVTPESGTETVTRYVWGLDLSQSVQGAGGIGGLLLQEKDDAAGQTKTRLYTYEANGNVGQLVDGTTGVVVAHYAYAPFGTTLTASGTAATANPFRFSTKYTDADTTLVYYGYRFYSPTLGLGRWLTRDPIGESDSPGLYMFVGNNPLAWFDSNGLARRSIGSVVFDQDGHHIIPFAIVRDYGFSEAAAEVFSKATKETDIHTYLIHGRKSGYTLRVEAELQKQLVKFRRENHILCAMTDEQEVRFARKFVNHIRHSRDPFLRGYLDNVKEYKKLSIWAKNVGRALPMPKVLPLAKYKFLPKMAIKGGMSALRNATKFLTNGVKIGRRRIPIVKYLLIGATFSMYYDTYIDQGATPSRAREMAIIETINPYPIGILEFNQSIRELNMKIYGEYYYGGTT